MIWRLVILKTICGLILLTSFRVLAVETSAEVLEAEKLIATQELAAPLAPVPSAVVEAPAQAQVVETSKNESEIPVQLEAPKKSESDHSVYFKVAMSLLVVGGMGVGSYVLIGRYRRANLTKNPATQIKVLTQHYLGPKKSLAIVRVAGESILIGITDQNISMLKSLALLDEEIPDETPTRFASLMNANLANKNTDTNSDTNELSGAGAPASERTEDEEFSIAGIKDFVSTRLKNMRTFE